MEPNPAVVEMWFHYEEIAMHFNELIIQYRLQLLGGMSAISAFSSYFFTKQSEDVSSFKTVRASIFTILTVVFVAAASLDLFYYSLLLEGAVQSIIELEAKHPYLNLSTTISSKFSGSPPNIIFWVYSAILVPLAGFTIYCWREVFRT